jgi:hypothetical protein
MGERQDERPSEKLKVGLENLVGAVEQHGGRGETGKEAGDEADGREW